MRPKGGDASFLIGVILGIALGAAIAVILAEAMQDNNSALNDDVERAKESLESMTDRQARITGASEGEAPV
jgi:uncharacterized membrane-anchored protein YhcB (DUF1043 family)